jgi:outer membrane immunogenic protein
MRKSLISVFAGAGLSLAASGLALAADMVVKAPPPAPVFSWTGFYVGGNIGYSWGKASVDSNDAGIAFFPA